MVDLGKYAGVVTSAYAVSLIALAVLVAVYVIRNKRVRDSLTRLEDSTDA